MQDRFKFRFFDKKENFLIDENTDPDKCIKLYDKDEWWWCAEHGLTTVLDYFDHCSYIKSRDFAIMQCTGLKDKNGKLIYEGDYIKNLKTNTIYKVFWEDKATCFMLKSTRFGGVVSTYMMFEEYPNDLEVIGNIYENSELLESN